jgi:hypothetical protein
MQSFTMRLTRCLVVMLLSFVSIGVQEPGYASGGTHQVSSGATMTIEFDLPLEYDDRDRQNRFVVTGFIVGFFRGSDSEPALTIDVTRDSVRVDGRKGRLTVSRYRDSDGGPVVVRLVTVTREALSDWSEPSPALPGAARDAARPSRPAGAGGRRLDVGQVEQHPRLIAALKELLPPNADLAPWVGRFRTMNELAMTVVVSRDHGIAFAVLAAKMQGPPRRSLRNALRELKPTVRGTNPLKPAQAQAKALLGSDRP